MGIAVQESMKCLGGLRSQLFLYTTTPTLMHRHRFPISRIPGIPLITYLQQMHTLIASAADAHLECLSHVNNSNWDSAMCAAVRYQLAAGFLTKYLTEDEEIQELLQEGLSEEEIHRRKIYITPSLLIADDNSIIDIYQFLHTLLTEKEFIPYSLYEHVSEIFIFDFRVMELKFNDFTLTSSFTEIINQSLSVYARPVAPPLCVLFAHSHFNVLYKHGEQQPSAPNPTRLLSDILAWYDKDADEQPNKHHSAFLRDIFASKDTPIDSPVMDTLRPFFVHLHLLQNIDPSLTLLDLLSLTSEGCNKLQSKLSAPMKDTALKKFKADVAATQDKYLISHVMSTLEPEATLYLRSTEPSDEQPESFRRSLCRTLRIDPNNGTTVADLKCPCNKSNLDDLGEHAYNCQCSQSFKVQTHNAVTEIFVQALKAAEVAVAYEPKHLIRDELTGANRVPDFTILGHLDDDNYPPGTYADCMITTTHPAGFTNIQALTPHDRCLYGVKYKLDQYATVTNNHLLVPIIFDSAGHMAKVSMHLLDAICRKISSSNQIPFSVTKNYWLKKISCALHQGITADITNIEKSAKRHRVTLQGVNTTAKQDCVDTIFIHERESMSDSNPMYEKSLRE